MLKKICLLAVSSLYFAGPLFPQSAPSATTRSMSLYAGGEYSTFNADWGCLSDSVFSCWNRHLTGITVLASLNHVHGKIGMEGEARWLHWGGPGGGLVQSNYLVGPRYPFLRSHAVNFFAKGLVGESSMVIPLNYGKHSYFTIATGATVEVSITKRLVARADYEYQIWPTFAGLAGLPNGGLTPNGLSFGMSYRLR